MLSESRRRDKQPVPRTKSSNCAFLSPSSRRRAAVRTGVPARLEADGLPASGRGREDLPIWREVRT
jgi:hypothetical protein